MAADSSPPGFETYAEEPVPQAAVGAPGKAGRLSLTFATDADGRTRLAHDRARAPYHVAGTLGTDPHPDAATVVIQTSNGGVAQGDRNEVDVEARAGTVARVTTGSATKVFSMEQNYGATERTLTVEGGHLEFVPAPTILHADARYAETTAVHLRDGATAVLGDVLVPGRLARGEAFGFDRYAGRVRVEGSAGLLVEDAARLVPTERDPRAPGVLGGSTVYGSLYVLAPGRAADLGDPLHDRVRDAAASSSVSAGATALPNDAGVLVRALGDRADGVTAALHAAWDTARRALIDAPAPDRRVW